MNWECEKCFKRASLLFLNLFKERTWLKFRSFHKNNILLNDKKKQYNEYIYIFSLKNYLLLNRHLKIIIIIDKTFVSIINRNFMSFKSILIKSYNISSHSALSWTLVHSRVFALFTLRVGTFLISARKSWKNVRAKIPAIFTHISRLFLVLFANFITQSAACVRVFPFPLLPTATDCESLNQYR